MKWIELLVAALCGLIVCIPRVMAQLDAAAKTANYNLTDEARQRVSDMIDAMCDMAHTVNGSVSNGY